MITRRTVLAIGGLSMLPWVGKLAAQDAKKPAPGGVLRVAVYDDPRSIFSPIETGDLELTIGSKIFESLLRLKADNTFEGVLAESWKYSPDGKEYEFKLRDNTRFHDGQPLTSEDIAFSIMELGKKHNAFGSTLFANVIAADLPDAKTVVFKLSKPMPPFPFLGTLAAFAPIAPKHIYGTGDILKNPKNNTPIGTGPFRFKEWNRGSSIVLDRNPDYREKSEPYLDQVVFRIITDPGARAAAFEADEVDAGVNSPVSKADLKRLAELPFIAIDASGNKATEGVNAIEVNLRRKELSDVRVRRAISMSIDRNFICKAVYEGMAAPAHGPIRSDSFLFDAELPQLAFNVEEANKLLDDAGYPKGADGWRFNLNIDPNGDDLNVIGDYIKQALAGIGINGTIIVSDYATHNARIYTDYDFDLSVQVISTLVDPQISVFDYYWSKAISKGRWQTNATDYRNEEMDKAIEDAESAIEADQRLAALKQFQKIAARDLPLIPLVEYESHNVFNKRVQLGSLGPVWPLQTWADAWLEK
ncbi:ABC transporter substrate-binding protein [Mesorhizobium sp. INR15]|uniref:ABC transporter substrate-binding protein n=1 Tax=Mesorhizobium sp. INR15 TaxID=2654248 RepID=UPI0018968169|nr:ABC transporter substrate-binding protein [Mesorhizobium sp. INR15]